MTVEILTPEKVFFKGDASGVKMPGISGAFEVLNNHAPLIAALSKGEVRLAMGDKAKVISISGGFVEVLNNHVILLAEGAAEA